MVIISCNSIKTKTMKVYKFKFDTQYNQFYLTSDNGEFLNSDLNKGQFLEDFNQSFDERLDIKKNALVIFTQSYGNIKGEIEVLEKPNYDIYYSKYDHIVEGGINIQSGELQILDCPNSHLELSLKVEPAKYRVRVYSSNLSSVKETDSYNDTDNDGYRIEIWKSNDMERKVLKQYPSL